MGKAMRALGLMSGTSMDGIDVAVLETDGENAVRRVAARTFAYEPDLRQAITAALAEAAGLTDRNARPGALAELERAVTVRHAEAVAAFHIETGIAPGSIDIIGFHGQTVLHRPERRLTVQLGDGPLLARLTGRPVIYDMRAADVAAGGQGAPLVPVYHRALAAALALRPLALVNIGGVANVTWIGSDGQLIAFDTGPGNALLDDWMARHTGQAFDRDGATSLSGSVREDVLRDALRAPFFTEPPPKSLDRNAFAAIALDGASVADGAATLSALTAKSIARAREHMPHEPALWIVSGGGRHNRAVLERLAHCVECAVVPAEAVELDGDSLEAEAWAYLAVRSVRHLPISFPGTTGVARPMVGGIRVDPPSR